MSTLLPFTFKSQFPNNLRCLARSSPFEIDKESSVADCCSYTLARQSANRSKGTRPACNISPASRSLSMQSPSSSPTFPPTLMPSRSSSTDSTDTIKACKRETEGERDGEEAIHRALSSDESIRSTHKREKRENKDTKPAFSRSQSDPNRLGQPLSRKGNKKVSPSPSLRPLSPTPSMSRSSRIPRRPQSAASNTVNMPRSATAPSLTTSRRPSLTLSTNLLCPASTLPSPAPSPSRLCLATSLPLLSTNEASLQVSSIVVEGELENASGHHHGEAKEMLEILRDKGTLIHDESEGTESRDVSLASRIALSRMPKLTLLSSLAIHSTFHPSCRRTESSTTLQSLRLHRHNLTSRLTSNSSSPRRRRTNVDVTLSHLSHLSLSIPIPLLLLPTLKTFFPTLPTSVSLGISQSFFLPFPLSHALNPVFTFRFLDPSLFDSQTWSSCTSNPFRTRSTPQKSRFRNFVSEFRIRVGQEKTNLRDCSE